MNSSNQDVEVLRLREALAVVKIGRSSFYQAIKNGFMPPPKKLGGVSVWFRSELNEALANLGNSSNINEKV